MTVNDESKRIWKEEVVAYFKVLSRNLPGGTGGNMKLRIEQVDVAVTLQTCIREVRGSNLGRDIGYRD
jgi:hypothetical protein